MGAFSQTVIPRRLGRSWLTARKPPFLSDRPPLPFTKSGMESVLVAALLAASPMVAPAEANDASAGLDLRCFSLMAELAEADDPRIRGAGRIAAQYFLGRIDAGSPGFDPEAAPAPASGAARERLLRECSAALEGAGRDFRTIGETLAPSPRPTA